MAIGSRIKKAAHSAEEALRREFGSSANKPHTDSQLDPSLQDSVANVVQNTMDQISSAFDLVTGGGPVDIGGHIPSTNPAAPVSITDRIHRAVQSTENRITSGVSGAVSSIVNDITGGVSNVTAPFNDVLDDVGNTIDDIGDQLSHAANAISNIPDDISNAINGTEQRIEHAYQTVTTRVQVFKDDVSSGIRTFAHDAFTDLKYVLMFGGIGLLLLWYNTSGIRHEAYESAKTLGKRTFNEFKEIAPKAIATAPFLLV